MSMINPQLGRVMAIDLVIFDYDGVLADSEITLYQNSVDELARLGIAVAVENFIKDFTGLSFEAANQLLQAQHGSQIPDNFFHALVERSTIKDPVVASPMPGIKMVIQYLIDQQIPVCVASNRLPNQLNAALVDVKLASYFTHEQVYSAAMVKRSKPAPDLFLHLIDKMQVNSQNCLAIEDSVAGIAAAKGANIPVIGFLGGLHAKYPWYQTMITNAQPWQIAHDAAALLNILKRHT